MKNNYRHGDINLHSIEKIDGEIIKHKGVFVIGEGETTGHRHLLTVENPKDLIIKKDSNGDFYFQLLSKGTLTHEEHKTLEIMPGIYKRIQEREKDWFSLAVRKVID